MLVRPLKLWSMVLPAICCMPAFGQALHQEGAAPRRALLVVNSKYQKLDPPPVDDSGVAILEGALKLANFDVKVHRDLGKDDLLKILDAFRDTQKPGEVSLFYYSGYILHDQDNYLVPLDFDPDSNAEVESATYALARLEGGLADKNPLLSMFVLDASWSTEKLLGRAGLSRPDPHSHTWILASAGSDQVIATNGNTGLFTSAFAKAVQQQGLDLNEISTTVKADVEAASGGGQHPQSWSSDPAPFFFHPLTGIKAGTAKHNHNDGSVYVYIPPGVFWMGCVPPADRCNPEEKPRHLVEVTAGYWLGQTEVTNQAYQSYSDSNHLHWKPKKHITDAGKQGDIPVVDASWEDSKKYCQWAAKGGRLPTEAEWERAARGGTETVYPYPDLGTSRENANFGGRHGRDRFPDLAPVTRFDPNAYSLYDMAGNVWERVLDWYRADYYSLAPKDSPMRDPQGPTEPDQGKSHVMRGGSWYDDPPEFLRISYRRSEGAALQSNNVGFRCLLPDTPEVNAVLK